MNKRYYSFVGIYTFAYSAIGVLTPLIGQYLAGIGFTGVQIGTITSAATLIGICASPFWGYRSHHSKDSTRIVLLLCIVTMITSLGMIFLKGYMTFLLAYAVFAFFQTPINPLTDAMTLEAGISYGGVRKWGAMGFAVGVFIAGQLAAATSLIIIFPLCAFGYTVAWIILARLRIKRKKEMEFASTLGCESNLETSEIRSKHQFQNLEKKKHGDYRILLKNKKLMALMISAFFICGTNLAHNTYFGFLYKEVGGSIAGLGVAFLLMCGGEAPFMAWADRLAKRFTTEKLILVCMIISALRYLWYSTGPAPEFIIGTFFLQGMVVGVVLVELIRYITKLVDPAMVGMVMTLYQAFSSNCSSILCQLIGGAILDHYSGRQVYLFFAIYNMIGIILYVGFGLYKGSNINTETKI